MHFWLGHFYSQSNITNGNLKHHYKGIARTQSPTNKNYALELPIFGAIVGVSQTEVQWNGLILEEPPSWSRLTSVPGKYAIFWNVKTVQLFRMAWFRWKFTSFLLIIFWVQKSIRNREAKVLSLAISGGLATASHSLALSHYWPIQGLLAAEFSPWPITPSLSQPDPPWLPRSMLMLICWAMKKLGKLHKQQSWLDPTFATCQGWKSNF